MKEKNTSVLGAADSAGLLKDSEEVNGERCNPERGKIYEAHVEQPVWIEANYFSARDIKSVCNSMMGKAAHGRGQGRQCRR